jgi:hypothetical protein
MIQRMRVIKAFIANTRMVRSGLNFTRATDKAEKTLLFSLFIATDNLIKLRAVRAESPNTIPPPRRNGSCTLGGERVRHQHQG